ncbi:hypothetical protein IKA15_01955, partial [bacterium]|nr:hypothetical protein [bacterium]
AIVYSVLDLSSAKNILHDFEQKEEYNKYLKANNCKQHEDVISEYIDKGINPDTEDEIIEKENKLINTEIDLCEEFIKSNPKNLYARERIASLYNSSKDYESAINNYAYLMKIAPSNFDYVQSCAEAYAHWNNLNYALMLINNFYKNKKQDDKYFNALGSIFEAAKDYELAIKNYSEAIKLKPYWLYYSHRATLYLQNGEMAKYRADREKRDELFDEEKDNIAIDSGIKSNYGSHNKILAACKIGLILLLLIISFYYHPTKETMTCGYDMTCEIEKMYFGVLKFNKKIKLNSASNLYCRVSPYAITKRSVLHGLYLKVDDTAPFVFYVSMGDEDEKELYDICNQHQREFRRYLENYGEFPYKIKSSANVFMLVFMTIFIFGLACYLFR